ncbi:MAG: hypothetical protein ACHQIM_21565 [Sphingobacteriales bacterium]
MSNSKLKTVFVLMALSVLAISGCVKDTTIMITNDKAVTAKVSFSKDLIPLFAANCAISGCHVAEHQAPDLEKAVAYKSISNLKLFDTNTPENSILYQRLTGKLVPAMPMGKTTNPSNINNEVLAWIKQGALNN